MSIYLSLVVVSIVCRLIYEVKYERYKKREGFKNNYKGSYLFKDFAKNPILKLLSFAIAFGVPVVQLLPMASLAFFRLSSVLMLAREMADGTIEKVDEDIVDVAPDEVEILSGDVVDNDRESGYDYTRSNEDSMFGFGDDRTDNLSDLFTALMFMSTMEDLFNMQYGSENTSQGNLSDAEFAESLEEFVNEAAEAIVGYGRMMQEQENDNSVVDRFCWSEKDEVEGIEENQDLPGRKLK